MDLSDYMPPNRNLLASSPAQLHPQAHPSSRQLKIPHIWASKIRSLKQKTELLNGRKSDGVWSTNTRYKTRKLILTWILLVALRAHLASSSTDGLTSPPLPEAKNRNDYAKLPYRDFEKWRPPAASTHRKRGESSSSSGWDEKDSGTTDGLATTIPNNRFNAHAYLTDENGQPLSATPLAEISRKAYRCYDALYKRNRPAPSFGKLGNEANEYFVCKRVWKVQEYYGKLTFPDWKRNHYDGDSDSDEAKESSRQDKGKGKGKAEDRVDVDDLDVLGLLEDQVEVDEELESELSPAKKMKVTPRVEPNQASISVSKVPVPQPIPKRKAAGIRNPLDLCYQTCFNTALATPQEPEGSLLEGRRGQRGDEKDSEEKGRRRGRTGNTKICCILLDLFLTATSRFSDCSRLRGYDREFLTGCQGWTIGQAGAGASSSCVLVVDIIRVRVEAVNLSIDMSWEWTLSKPGSLPDAEHSLGIWKLGDPLLVAEAPFIHLPLPTSTFVYNNTIPLASRTLRMRTYHATTTWELKSILEAEADKDSSEDWDDAPFGGHLELGCQRICHWSVDQASTFQPSRCLENLFLANACAVLRFMNEKLHIGERGAELSRMSRTSVSLVNTVREVLAVFGCYARTYFDRHAVDSAQLATDTTGHEDSYLEEMQKNPVVRFFQSYYPSMGCLDPCHRTQVLY
ncbi:hypothetical protein BDN72DRAFT_856963 [Pluteus cervinus]|uniref:Uncharacterized protein n=1 Tax=Pluteus cervinus TaxID=181527 RepID=A0ACD3AX99_9AGAR|nr:hypothetical protein BDN72DRAFT_856963 [Pluteus cervinus]